jgi:NTP pyrophosphatase (non-canonical NTP hydrolase)
MTDLNDLSKKIDDLIRDLGGYWPKEWLLQPVMEELGEFSKELQIDAGLHPNKTSTKEKLAEEYGDLLFAVMALGRGLKIDIEQALQNTISKYNLRDKKQ